MSFCNSPSVTPPPSAMDDCPTMFGYGCERQSELIFFQNFGNSNLGKWYNAFIQQNGLDLPQLDEVIKPLKHGCLSNPVANKLRSFCAANTFRDGYAAILHKLPDVGFLPEDAQIIFASLEFVRNYFSERKIEICRDRYTRDAFRRLYEVLMHHASAIKRRHEIVRHHIFLGMGKASHGEDEELKDTLSQFVLDQEMKETLYDDTKIGPWAWVPVNGKVLKPDCRIIMAERSGEEQMIDEGQPAGEEEQEEEESEEPNDVI